MGTRLARGIRQVETLFGAESQIRFLEIASEALGDSALGLHLAQHFLPRAGRCFCRNNFTIA
jgi:hypothetical protein